MNIDNFENIEDYRFDSLGTIPVLALRGLVVFPESVIHFDVARTASVAAVNAAMKANQLMFVTAQKDPLKSRPTPEDLYDVGTVVKIVQTVRQPDNTTKVIVEGLYRGVALELKKEKSYFEGNIVSCEYNGGEPTVDQLAMMRVVKSVQILRTALPILSQTILS